MSFRHSQKFFEELATNQTLQAEDSNSETKMFIKKIGIIIFTFVIFIGLVGESKYVENIKKFLLEILF